FLCDDPLSSAFYCLSLHVSLPIYSPRPVQREPRHVEEARHGGRTPKLEKTFHRDVELPDEIAEVRHDEIVAERVVPRGDRRVSRDRKSTRLNSSHVKISYAVFCLK